MKYKITCSYDGSKFYGLEKQKDLPTIQRELEKALTKCNEAPVKVSASGRTDRGVHAHEQVCTFNLDKNIDAYKLKGYLNRTTSKYLYINTCESIDDDNFHARFSVKSKVYKYIINTGFYNPIKEDYLYNYNHPLNIKSMKDSSKLLIGTHNFRAFIIGKHQSYTSTIEKIDIEQEDNNIIITIKGTHFYTYMVRNIISVLILIGNKTISEQDILKMLETGRKIFEYSPAPAGGLYLEKVNY